MKLKQANKLNRPNLPKEHSFLQKVTANYKLEVYQVILFFALLIGIVIFFPGQKFNQFREYEKGSLAPAEIKAPFTFPMYKTDEELEGDRQDAAQLIAPLFDRRVAIENRQKAKLDEVIQYFYELRSKPKPFYYLDNQSNQQLYVPPDYENLRNILQRDFQINIIEKRWSLLTSTKAGTDDRGGSVRLSNTDFKAFTDFLLKTLSDVFAYGVLDTDKNKYKTPIAPIIINENESERSEFIKNVNDMDESKYRVLDILRNRFGKNNELV